MTETAPEYREDDQILSHVQTVRQRVMPILAPRLADEIEILCRLVTTYRLKERRAAALRSVLNGE
jgi:hypothetical protein